MTLPAPALKIADLTKRFSGIPAVNQLNLNIAQGEFHALLGPNGAGKTTTLRMVAGLLNPDLGSIEILGHDLKNEPIAAKQQLAYLPDEPLVYGKLRPLEYLEFVAALWNIPPTVAGAQAESLLRSLDLWVRLDDRIESFSLGMKQKLALAGALIHDPRLLVLDEPLNGLDAASARLVKDLLIARVVQGGTVVLTTHVLEVAERLADRISIVHEGRVVAQGCLDELRVIAQCDGNASLEEIFLQLVD